MPDDTRLLSVSGPVLGFEKRHGTAVRQLKEPGDKRGRRATKAGSYFFFSRTVHGLEFLLESDKGNEAEALIKSYWLAITHLLIGQQFGVPNHPNQNVRHGVLPSLLSVLKVPGEGKLRTLGNAACPRRNVDSLDSAPWCVAGGSYIGTTIRLGFALRAATTAS